MKLCAPSKEPGLDELMDEAVGNLTVRTEVVDSDVFLISVPTPLESTVKVADLKAVRLAAEMI